MTKWKYSHNENTKSSHLKQNDALILNLPSQKNMKIKLKWKHEIQSSKNDAIKLFSLYC